MEDRGEKRDRSKEGWKTRLRRDGAVLMWIAAIAAAVMIVIMIYLHNAG